MPYKINQQEMTNVLALAGPERYKHFIKRVADWEELWGLQEADGWVTFGTDENTNCLPFWPHLEYARLSAVSEWNAAVPTRIELTDFMRWLPEIEEKGYLVAVFPTPSGKGVVVSALQLQEHLAVECDQYE